MIPLRKGAAGAAILRSVSGRFARYLLKEVALLYVLGVAAFCLLLSVDYLSVMAGFLIDQDAGALRVLRLLLYKLPYFLHLSLPVAGVFAVLLATGRLARDSELKAAYALAVPPTALLTPLLLFGTAASFLALVNNGWLEPLAERSYNVTVESFYSSRPPTERQLDAAFSLPDGSVHYAAEMRSLPEDPGLAELRGVFILRPDGSALSAAAGVWDSREREWQLEDAQELTPEGEPLPGGPVSVPFAFAGSPASTLMREEMLTLSELGEQVRNSAAAGSQTRQLSYSLHRRVADAFSGLCFVLVAAVLGVSVRGRATAFALTIALLLLFYTLWTVSATLFDRSVLTAVQAAWLTPVSVAAAGLLTGFVRLSR